MKSKLNLKANKVQNNGHEIRPKIENTKQTVIEAFINKTIRASNLANTLLYAEVFEAQRTR